MANVPAPKKTKNNLEVPEAAGTKALNFKVSPEFHREFKTYATMHNLSMVGLLDEAFKVLKEVRG